MIIQDSLIRQEGGANTLRCSRSLPGVKPARDLTVYTNTQWLGADQARCKETRTHSSR